MDTSVNRDKIRIIEKQELPDIDLYMDQVTGLLNDKLGNLEGEEKEAVLTKTMINNYVKSGVVDKPHRKRYSKDQLMQLILLYGLKNVLPLQQIKEFMEMLVEEGAQEGFEGVYDRFLAVQKEVAEQRLDASSDAEPSLDEIVEWAVLADLYKRMTVQALRQKK